MIFAFYWQPSAVKSAVHIAGIFGIAKVGNRIELPKKIDASFPLPGLNLICNYIRVALTFNLLKC